MEAKEKAEKMIEKFMFADMYFTEGNHGARKNARFCASLAVNEILNELSDLPRIPYNERREKFWQDVKTELLNSSPSSKK